jgi:hypothetical protein
MKDDLKDFRRKLSDAGRATYAARARAHDDLFLTVAIACWWISRPPPPQAVSGIQVTSGKLTDQDPRRLREMNSHL